MSRRYYNRGPKVITWQNVYIYEKADLCREHSSRLAGGYQVSHGLHRSAAGCDVCNGRLALTERGILCAADSVGGLGTQDSDA